MAQARSGSSSSSPLLVLNEGLNDILIAMKEVSRNSSITHEEKLLRYENLRFENIKTAYERYMEQIPPPGSMLTSKDFRVLSNLRQVLSGAFSLFESRAWLLIENYGDLISFVEKGHRKRPALKQTARNRADEDSLALISMIAQASSAPVASVIEHLEDFDLEKLFKERGNKNTAAVTMEDVRPCPALPVIDEELLLESFDVFNFDAIMAEVGQRVERTPTKVPPLTTEAFPDLLRADEGGNQTLPDAQRGPAGILLDATLPDAVHAPILEKEPAQITPPEKPGIPRLALEEVTDSREREPLEVEMRRRLEEMAAKKTVETKSKKIRRQKGSLPFYLLKKDSFRRNLQLTSARVNKIVDKRSTADIFNQKWVRGAAALPDPYSDVKLLQDAEACIYQYKYWKKYTADLPGDVDEIDLVIQCFQEEVINVSGRTPLRGLSAVSNAVEGQTPQRHAAPSPSPRQPVLDPEELDPLEVIGGVHTPSLAVPVPSRPARKRSDGLHLKVPSEEQGIGRRVLDPLELIGDEHTPLLAVPVPFHPAWKRSDSLPTKVPSEKEVLGRRLVDPLELIRDEHTPSVAVPVPPRPARKPSDELHTKDQVPSEGGSAIGRRMEVDESGIPGEDELSDASRAQNAYERREHLRVEVVGKLREEFTKEPSAVLSFTDLCPLSSTKHRAAETFFILLELWEAREVSLSQESPKPQHIFIRAGKRHTSSTDTCSDSSTA